MTKEGIEANLDIIAHDIFDDCVSDIEQYIADGIYNKQLVQELEEFLIMKKQCLRLFADRIMLYTLDTQRAKSNKIRSLQDNIYEFKLITMNTIKFTSKTTLLLNNKKYKSYTVGDLPKKFAYLYDEYDETDGIYQWFNYKGLTYIEDTK